jgi:iron complex transport system ATP-binding protein
MTILTTSKLGVRLGTAQILHDVTLTAAAGEVIGVLGPNGAGKSTLLKALAGLVRYQGNAELDGAQVSGLPLGRLARVRSFLPQGGAIHWPLTVRALVALGRHASGDATTPKGQEAIDRAMAAANVEVLADRNVLELSGGERARALLARALAAEAPVLIADEPAAQLDPRHHWQCMDVLRQAALARGALVIVALHDLSVAARMCSRVWVLHEGGIAADGPPAACLTPDLLAKVFGVDAHIGVADGASYIVPLRATA